MRYLISSLAILVFLSCSQNSTKPKEPGPVQKDSQVTKPAPVDTPKIASAPATPLTKEQLWDVFWTKFSAAVNQRDKKGMIALSLQGPEFFDGGGGGTAAEWINSADNETWKYWQKAITKGTKVFDKTLRITNDEYMIFEFKDGKWVWNGVMGD